MEKEPDRVDSPIGDLVGEMLTSGVEDGIPAGDVADQFVAAVDSGQFWILTHEDMAPAAGRADATCSKPDEPANDRNQLMGTSTSAFGAGKRESHDATDFYARFASPEISDDDTLGTPGEVDVIHLGGRSHMTCVPDASVATGRHIAALLRRQGI